MVQINDDYYEDLTPESGKTLLAALKKSAEDTSGKTAPPPAGPLSGRKSCENSAGLTTLRSEPWGAEITRSDL